ncbi:UNVERIFIED_CONTAM: Histone deacetylase 6 [Sesamum radiatum]|uniref:Histone deacetylase n=1 Tax=Sesamum radiatum TaxID=300843 RepID=A0AAW2MYX4_SESRA
MDPGSGASLPSSCPDARKRRVSYFYEPTIGDYYYGQGHPMKPHRIRMAHNLIVHYALHRRMEISRPFPAGPKISAVSTHRSTSSFCPPSPPTRFTTTHTRVTSSASMLARTAPCLTAYSASARPPLAALSVLQSSSIGRMLILRLIGLAVCIMRRRRVLYVDIDIHHGDGVEEAFYVTDRVMTVSFHKFGDFFPGTGHIKDIGAAAGKYYALNVPLNDGVNDENFRTLFRPIIQKVMEVYQPDAVVLQCGADSLAGDRLGCFNLSVKGHADCLRFLRSFNVPLMVLGGGGYTIRNVARCWCYETAVAVDVEPDNRLPYNEYYEYFGPDYTLHVEPSHMENLNTERDLEKIRNMLLEQLSKLQHVPSVPFQTMPPTTEVPEEREEDMEVRPKPRIWNGQNDYESDDDEDEKPLQRSLNSDATYQTSTDLRGSSDTVKEEDMTDDTIKDEISH